VRVRDHHEFERFVDDHQLAVWRYALRRAEPADVDDVVAETFAVAWRRWREARAGGRPWLYRTASFVLANRNRGRARETRLFVALAALPTDTGQGDLEAVEQRLAIAGLLQQLSASERELVALLYWEGLSVREASAVLGCTTAAAYVRLHRLRARLRRAPSRPAVPEPARRTS
jgi:RNA polymerase sigma-70 factor (ECF subfamily)